MSTDTTNNSDASSQTTSSSPSEYEIEKKFPISKSSASSIEQTLTKLGFQQTHKEEFTDWYFDLPSPHWYFSTLNDTWIQYRETKVKLGSSWGWRGVWQVKRGKSTRRDQEDDNDSAGLRLRGREDDGMTVYEEFQGKVAKAMVLDMLSRLDLDEAMMAESSGSSAPRDALYEGHDVPRLDGDEILAPFARFKTFRTSWQIPPTSTTDEIDVTAMFTGLKVDIDSTDFGYSVGEVEAVIANEDGNEASIEAAKEKIRTLVGMLNCDDTSKDDNDPSMAIGKLEWYLINNRRDHYDACVEAGVMMT